MRQRVARLSFFCVVWFAASSRPGLAAVPTPWTPVKVDHSADKKIKVRVWGREYHFDESPLPARIVSQDADVLAGAVQLAVYSQSAEPATSSDAEPQSSASKEATESLDLASGRLVWTKRGVKVWESDERRAILGGYLANDAATVNVTVTIEFDGLMRFDLCVIPNKRPVDGLFFEMPLKPEAATLRHYWPGDESPGWPSIAGSVRSSGAMPDDGLKLPFQPVLWIGNEERGLSWFCESDEAWRPRDRNRVIEVVMDKGAPRFRVHLNDGPLERGIRLFTMAVQATPVKPFSRRLETHHQFFNAFESHAAYRGGVYDLPPSYLDEIAAKGVKTFYVWNEWTPALGHWRAAEADERKLRQFIKECHDRGMKVMPYFGEYLSTQSPEIVRFAHRTAVDPQGISGPPYQSNASPQAILFFSLNDPEWRETYLRGLVSAVERYGFDGVYLDGQVLPRPCANPAVNTGYTDPEGKIRPTFPLFGGREFFRRLYEELHTRGKIIDAHNSSYCGTINLGFVDHYWDGEQLGWGKNDSEMLNDPLREFPLETFRAEFMGRNFGIPCEFLEYDLAAAKTKMAITLLHGVLIRPTNDESLEWISTIWKAMDEFGVSHADWSPYYQPQERIRSAAAGVKFSYWALENNGEQRLLLVATNFAPKATRANFKIADHVHLRENTARDALTREPLTLANRNLSADLPASSFRVIEVR